MRKSLMGLLSVLLVLMLALPTGVLAETAVGDFGAEDDGTTVNFWSLFTGADGAQMIEMLDAYNATNPEVKITAATQDWDNYYTKLKTSIMGGEAPDLCVVHDVYAWGLINDGCLVPLDDAAASVGVEFDYAGYVPKLEDLKYDDHYYAIPIDCLQLLFSYNKEILGAAGVLDENGMPMIGEGIEGLVAMFETIKEKTGVNPFGATLSTSGSVPMYLFNSLYYQFGGKEPFVSADGKTWQMDPEAGLKAAEMFQRIGQLSMPNIQNLAEIFLSEQCATVLEGAWQMNYYRENLGEDKYGVIKLPLFGDEYRTAVYSHTFVLPASETRDDAKTKGALEFVKWFGENSAMWAKAGSMPAYMPAQETELFASYPMHPNFSDAPLYSTPLTFTAPFALKGSPEMNEPLGKLANGEITPQQCLDEMAERMTTALR